MSLNNLRAEDNRKFCVIYCCLTRISGVKVPKKILHGPLLTLRHANGLLSVVGLVLNQFFVTGCFKLSANLSKQTRQKGGFC